MCVRFQERGEKLGLISRKWNLFYLKKFSLKLLVFPCLWKVNLFPVEKWHGKKKEGKIPAKYLGSAPFCRVGWETGNTWYFPGGLNYKKRNCPLALKPVFKKGGQKASS